MVLSLGLEIGFLAIIQQSAVVPYTPPQMFDLLNDIEQYPLFLPWCQAVEIRERSENEVLAKVTVVKGFWRQTFTTRNRLFPHEKVEMRLQDGPFRYLEGKWQFQSLHDVQTRISLYLSYEFNNSFLAFAANPIISQMTGTLVKAFTQRADQIYAK